MAKPLLDIHCIEEQYCDYPVAVKIAMDDGTIQTYTLDHKVDMQLINLTDRLNRFTEMTVGYMRKEPKGKKKRRLHNRQL